MRPPTPLFNAAWFALSEVDFLTALGERLTQTGELGDVFAAMVNYNVPRYILRKLWPESYEFEFNSPRWLAFAASEPDWHGRIANLKSTAIPSENTRTAHISVNKNFVMTADAVYFLLRAGSDTLAIALYEPKNSIPGDQLSWALRAEATLTTMNSAGARMEHWRVTGTATVPKFTVFNERQYRTLGSMVPLRELTSLGYLAAALLKRAGWLTATGSAVAEQILDARAEDRLGKAQAVAAASLITELTDRTKQAGTEDQLHPLWFWAAKSSAARR